MTSLRGLILAAMLLPPLAGVSAQAPPSTMPDTDPTASLKRHLRNLVTAQEAFWVDHGTYTTDVSALGMYKRAPATPADSEWVQVIQAGGRSWWGRAGYRGRGAKSCIIYVGTRDDFTATPTTDATKVKAENEAQPVCDPF